MAQFVAYNGPSPTTAAQQKIATGTAIKTMLQIAPPAGTPIQLVEWGISFDGSAAATPGQVELIQTDVAATVTAYVASGLVNMGRDNATSAMQIGSTTLSGYTGTAEGTITATKSLDTQLIAPTSQYIKQWIPNTGPWVLPSKFLRIRVTFAASINATCYVVWTE